jgi:hypothetical protein
MIFGSTGWEGSSVGSAALLYKGHRYPVEVISHCVWLYHRFPLPFREVEELMLERGIIVSYETIRRWCAKFGQTYANALRRRQPQPGDKWHLDEVFISAFSGISPHFRPSRHLIPASHYRAEMTVRFAIWEQITGVASLAIAA